MCEYPKIPAVACPNSCSPMCAFDRERHDDPIPLLELALVDLRTDLFHNAHRLVAHDVAGLHERYKPVQQMQVRPADARRRHADDRIPPVDDLRVRHILDLRLVRGTPD
jgi:hypothetical protein